MRRISPLVFGLATILLSAAFAADSNSPWCVRVWQADGLPEKNITGVAQAHDGFLWVATNRYLSRFDGARFESYRLDQFAPGSQKIRFLSSTPKVGLWMTLDHGPMLQLAEGAPQLLATDPTEVRASSILADSKGGIWVSYTSGSIWLVKDRRSIQVTKKGESPSSMAEDSKGQIWRANEGKLSLFKDGKFETISAIPPISRCIGARDEGLWIMSGLILYRYTETGGLEQRGSLDLKYRNTRANVLFEDSSGLLWIGTTTAGLFCFDGDRFENVPTSHHEISCLTEDREGNLWAGTLGGGLNQVWRRAIVVEGAETGFSTDAIQSICADYSGRLWACTQNGGLVYRQGGLWTAFSESTELDGRYVTRVAADSSGAVWVGTRNRTLHRWQNGRLDTWSQAEGLIPHTIRVLTISSSNDVWISGDGPIGLQCFRDGKLVKFELPPPSKVIRAIVEDGTGSIWVGGDAGMLLRIKNGVLTDERKLISRYKQGIRCLYVTKDNSLWLAFDSGGIGRIKDGCFAKIDTTNGLYDSCVSQIIADDHGWIWFASNSGLFRVRQRELDEVAQGHTSRVQSVHYGGYGLPRLESSADEFSSSFRSSDGRLWIPIGFALAVVDPAKLRERSEPPKVLLTRLLADNRVMAANNGVSPTDAIDLSKSPSLVKLSAGLKRLDLEFSALSFSAPENVHFRYRLEGFDEHWSESGQKRMASYLKLPPGDYQFHVTACNSDGVWNETGTSVALSIAPFFWQTLWFQLISLISLIALVAATVRYISFRRLRLRLKVMEERSALDKERARIARDIHDDLGGTLTEVTLSLELARRAMNEPEKVDERLRESLAATRQLIKSLDETVWAVNPRNDTLPHLINYLGQFAVRFLDSAGIQCELDVPEYPQMHPVSAEVRHNLFLVVKEALNNIVRHSGAQRVKFQMVMSEGSLSMRLEDDGKGFKNSPDDGCADGLCNMRQRLADIGGRFDVQTQPRNGTRIELTIPCGEKE